MSKEKPISIPTSVEAQIRTRARNLPVDKCYVNKQWLETQMVTILITRKHTNGNITIGNYLIDLKLRGVKDCHYMFNESPLRLDGYFKRYPEMFEECDYSLVHNIIYAGLEFAGDFGFEPHRNFKTAQYILEEDTDDIPLMEIPLGEEGIPVLELRPEESGQSEIALLNKTAGSNFRIVYLDEKGNPKPTERSYLEVLEEVMKTGLDKFLDKRKGKLNSDTERQVLSDVMYMISVYSEEEKIQIDDNTEHILKDPRLRMEGAPSRNYENELALSIKYFEKGETDKAYAESRRVIDKYADDPLLWHLLLHNLSIDSDTVDEKTVNAAYSCFPDHPVIKAWYAEWLAQEDRTDEVLALFNHLSGLDALTTENIHIGVEAIPSFCFAYAMAWLKKGDIMRAEPYYHLIVRMQLDFRMGADIQEIMYDLRVKKLEEMDEKESENEKQLSDFGQ